MLQRTFLATMAAFAMAATANAGSMYVYLVIDPATTAGFGVPTVVASGGGTMQVNSTRSGSGTFHLYAVDDLDGSFGIKTFNVKINGGVTGTNNRSPIGNWDNGDDGTINFGFSDTTVRTGTGANPIAASQGVNSALNNPLIGGYGISAANFIDKAPGGTSNAYGSLTSGRWGVYADADLTSGVIEATGHVRNALFLGEGSWAGTEPFIDIATTPGNNGTILAYYNQDPGTTQNPSALSVQAAGNSLTFSTSNPFTVIPEPATLSLLGLALVGALGFIRRR